MPMNGDEDEFNSYCRAVYDLKYMSSRSLCSMHFEDLRTWVEELGINTEGDSKQDLVYKADKVRQWEHEWSREYFLYYCQGCGMEAEGDIPFTTKGLISVLYGGALRGESERSGCRPQPKEIQTRIEFGKTCCM